MRSVRVGKCILAFASVEFFGAGDHGVYDLGCGNFWQVCEVFWSMGLAWRIYDARSQRLHTGYIGRGSMICERAEQERTNHFETWLHGLSKRGQMRAAQGISSLRRSLQSSHVPIATSIDPNILSRFRVLRFPHSRLLFS